MRNQVSNGGVGFAEYVAVIQSSEMDDAIAERLEQSVTKLRYVAAVTGQWAEQMERPQALC